MAYVDLGVDEKSRQGSPDRFGYEWATYTEILPESREQLQRWLGSTTLESFAGKRVLDAGCGMGRNPYWMAKAGAVFILAIDLDEGSLQAARANLADLKNTQVEKCSIYDLSPEKFGQFDRVTSIGVVHHLSDPQGALVALWNCVSPGGDLIIWCYGREGNALLLPIIQALRSAGSRLPIWVTHQFARIIAISAWPFIKLIPWRTSYYRELRVLSFKNLESIIFDQMLPRIAHYWNRDEMEQLVAALGGNYELEFVQENSWCARIMKSE